MKSVFKAVTCTIGTAVLAVVGLAALDHYGIIELPKKSNKEEKEKEINDHVKVIELDEESYESGY